MSSPSDKQVGGVHYLNMDPQPNYVSQKWNLNGTYHSVLKYIARAGKKPANPEIQDIMKAIHYLELRKEFLMKQAIEAAKVDEGLATALNELAEGCKQVMEAGGPSAYEKASARHMHPDYEDDGRVE